MIVLKEIKKSENGIVCNAFVEDCDVAVRVTYDAKANSFSHGKMPRGYEWCVTHMEMAKRAIEQMISSGEIKSQKTILWY